MLSNSNLTSKNITDVYKQKLISFDSWLCLDLDNTIQESRIELGSDQWFTKLMEHACKIHPDKAEAINMVISVYHAVQPHIRTQAVEPVIIKIIHLLQLIGIPVIGLTSRGHEIQDATFRQLQEVGIDFMQSSPFKSHAYLETNDKQQFLYAQGIIFCGGKNKGECLEKFIHFLQRKPFMSHSLPKHVLMVDDKKSHCKTVMVALNKIGIRCNYIHYSHLDDKVKQLNMENAHVQLNGILDRLDTRVQEIIHKLGLTSVYYNTSVNNFSLFKHGIYTPTADKPSDHTLNVFFV